VRARDAAEPIRDRALAVIAQRLAASFEHGSTDAIPGHLAPLDARDGSCWVRCEGRRDERVVGRDRSQDIRVDGRHVRFTCERGRSRIDLARSTSGMTDEGSSWPRQVDRFATADERIVKVR
jgi:hypothetical protein